MMIRNLRELKELERKLVEVVENCQLNWEFENSYRFEYEIVEESDIECRISFEISISSRFYQKRH